MITVKCPKCASKIEIGDYKTEHDDKTAVFCSNEGCSFYGTPLIGIDRKTQEVLISESLV